MKTKILLTVFCLSLLLGCSKEKENDDVSYPKFYNIHLNISKPDGSSYNEGEVEARLGYIDTEGNIDYYSEWSVFKVDQDFSDQMEEKYFGPFQIGGTLEESEMEPGTELVDNQLLFLRYEGSEEVDTIRAKDSLLYPEYRYFDIYKNDEFLKRFEVAENGNNEPWTISITR